MLDISKVSKFHRLKKKPLDSKALQEGICRAQWSRSFNRQEMCIPVVFGCHSNVHDLIQYREESERSPLAGGESNMARQY